MTDNAVLDPVLAGVHSLAGQVTVALLPQMASRVIASGG